MPQLLNNRISRSSVRLHISVQQFIMRHFLPLLLCATCSSARNGPLDVGSLFRRAVTAVNGVPTLDGVPLSRIPARPSVAAVTAGAINRAGWTVTCDSFQAGNECAKAIDGDTSTLWQSSANAPFPHSIIIDMKTTSLVGSVTIQPRQDGSSNGRIGQHTISLR